MSAPDMRQVVQQLIGETGVKVEVKSSAYLQSWRQRRLSRITFSGLMGRAYSDETNELAADPSLRADVYVFALYTCQDPTHYDVLDLDSWEFYMVPATTLREAGSPGSVTKVFLDRLAVPAVGFSALRQTINRLATGH
jgi:hypothetical protein